MFTIQKIDSIDVNVIRELISGYASDSVYAISRQDSDSETTFKLTLKTLDAPFIKTYGHLDEQSIKNYTEVVQRGHSFAAFEDQDYIGIAICEPMAWNSSFWVRELHVHPEARGRGVGRKLVDALKIQALAQNCRVVICETQNTNVPAIRFYRSVGFRLEGVDISYYTNEDYTKGEVAVFMKLQIG
jgi:streptothricin acetyltransferase